MFNYLKLKNFKSFSDIFFDLRNFDGSPNNLVVIYGENGSGKSNFVQAFDFLKETTNTMINKKLLDKLNEKENKHNIQDFKNDFYELVRHSFPNFELTEIVEEIRCIGTKDDIEIEYGFNINGVNGYYKMIFDTQIKYEELYYKISKRRGQHFKISQNRIELSSGIFFDKNYKEHLIENIQKYWGKNTFLSIIYNEINNVNKRYLKNRVNKNIFNVIDFFAIYNIKSNVNMGSRGRYSTKYPYLLDLDFEERGKINRKELKIKEEILRCFFTNLYSDVKDVYYQVDYDANNEITNYTLYFKKLIGGKIKDINFKYESTGTRHILELILPFIEAATGNIAIIDEADTGIHDILFDKLIQSIKDNITGQLILTTHNTTLLESIAKEHLYFIVVDYNGEKRMFNTRDYEERTMPDHNIRKRYLKGVYGGIPITGYFDFEDLVDELLEDNHE